MQQTTVNNYILENRKISFVLIQSILEHIPEISSDWLIRGEGEMYKEVGKVFIDDKRLELSIVPLYDVDVSAGLTRLFASGGSNIGSISIPNMPAADGAVHVTGDSMYPLIKPGDIIAYRVLNDISSITYGEIYILQLEHDGDTQVVVKYIKKSTQPDSVLLTSYNKEHDPMDVPRQWITQIARVAYTISKLSFI
jgi:phage repressor protein C with HTH and peptisase S24 domain